MRRSCTFLFFLLFSALLLSSAKSRTDEDDQLKEAYEEARNKIDQLTESLNFAELKVLQLNKQLEANKQQCSTDIFNFPGCGIYNGRLFTSYQDGWPWMAALFDDGAYYCGGSVISDRHILTAAQCALGKVPTEIKVRLGEFDFRVNSTFEVDFAVEKITTHSAYKSGVHGNDIAILKLKEPITFTGRIKPLCLPPKGKDVIGYFPWAAGWGGKWGKPVSPVLQEKPLKIWTKEKCRTIYPIGDDQTCAANNAGGVVVCQGNGGSPLMFETAGAWTIAGLVSFSKSCDDPTVYTMITAHLDWIKKSL